MLGDVQPGIVRICIKLKKTTNFNCLKTAAVNAKDKKSLVFPYNHQHKYFFIAAPLLFPTYFQIMTYRHAIVRRLYLVSNQKTEKESHQKLL